MADKIGGIVIPIGYDSSEAVQAIKELTKETSTSLKELSQIDRVLKFNPGNTELLEQKMKILGEAVGTTKEKLTLLKEAAEKASGSIETEKDQEAYRKLQREIIETESKLKLYGEKIDSVTNEMNGHIKKLDAVGDGLKNVGDKMKNVGDGMEKVGTGATKFVTGPILGIGAAAMVAWTEVDEAVDGIIAATGATGEEAEALEESFKNVAKSVPNSLGDVGTAVATLNKKLELQGEELEAATKAALQYADVNGVDVSSSVESVTKVMAAADIESKDFSKTLDKLTVVSQNSGVSVDDLTAAYEKSGPALRTLGYTFDESIAMMGQWEKAGLNSEEMLKGMQKYIVSNDKATETLTKTQDKEEKKLSNLNDKLDAHKKIKGKTTEETEKLKKKEEELTAKIKEQEGVVEKAGKMLEGTTAASREEMDKLVQSIKDSKDPQEKMNKAIEIFGTKNGPAFVEAIDSGKISYEEFAKVVGDSNGKLAETWEATQDPIDKFNEKMNNIKIIGAELGGELQEAAIPLIEDFGKAVEELAEWFSKLTDKEKENILKYGAIAAAVGPVLVIFGKLATGVGAVATASGNAVKGITSMFKDGGVFASGGAMQGLAGPIGIATVAVGLLAVAMWQLHEPQRTYNQNLKDTIQGITDFSTAVATAKPLIDDFDSYSSRYDSTISEKKKKISELEPEITTILADNVKERTRLTDVEMAKLKEYLGLLDELNAEIAKKYEVRLRVLDDQLKKETELNDTQAAHYISTVNKADSELSKNAQENHVQKLVQLDAMLENEKNLRLAGKTAEADQERAKYEELKAIADASYAQELADVNLSTVKRVTAVKDKFMQTNELEMANLGKVATIQAEGARLEKERADKEKAIWADKTLSMDTQMEEIQFLNNDYNEKIEKNKLKENAIWDTNTKKVSGALMEQVANIILHGGELDDETKKVVDTFLEHTSQTPEAAESFKKAMTDSIAKIVESEPELAGEAQTLVDNFDDVIGKVQDGKYELGGDVVDDLSGGITGAEQKAKNAAADVKSTVMTGLTPSEKETKWLGRAFSGGVGDGIREGEYLATNAARWLARQTENAFRQKLEINSPSGVMRKWSGFIPKGVALGIKDEAYQVEKAMADLAKIPQDIGWVNDPLIAGDFKRASQTQQMINNYPVINVNNPQLDSMERVRKLAEELYRLQNQRR